MSRVLSFPFRIDAASGQVVTVAVGCDQEAQEAIAMLVLTRLDEREMCPGFGVPDPAYTDDVDVAGEVQIGLDEWGPEGVTVTAERITMDGDVAEVTLMFERSST
jgi:hypothetical protein